MNKSIEHGWKVLNSNRTSHSMYRTSAYVEYPVGVWVCRPINCGPLAVFSEKFYGDCLVKNTRAIIVPCLFKRSQDNKLWFSIPSITTITTPRFTANFEKIVAYYVPIGTVFADEVMCEE